MTEDLLTGDFNVDNNPPLKDRLLSAANAAIHIGACLVMAYIVSYGFWYLAIAVNGLVKYSESGTMGRDYILVGIFLILFWTGDRNA